MLRPFTLSNPTYGSHQKNKPNTMKLGDRRAIAAAEGVIERAAGERRDVAEEMLPETAVAIAGELSEELLAAIGV